MSQHKALLLLGSDLGNRESNLERARILIDSEIGEIVKFGKITETKPVEFTSDTMFLNQLISIETVLSPIETLKKIKDIEKNMGRKYSNPLKGERYVSRIIDIDILTFSGIKYNSHLLNIPHPQIFNRDFVKIMMNEF